MTTTITNNAQTTLAGALTNTSITATLSPGSGALFPATASATNPFLITFTDAATGLINEIVKVTGITGDVITIVRAQEGTTAKSWIAGDIAASLITAGLLNGKVEIGDLQSNKYLSAVDTGTANSYIIAHTPAITALTDMMVLEFTVLNTNTGASTLTIDALTTVPLVGGAQAALQGAELLAGGKATAIYSTSLAKAILIGCTGAPTQGANATKSNHLMTLGQATGRLLGIQVFATPGTFTYTPTLGTNAIDIQVQAGGGGGGGSPTCSGTQVATVAGGLSGSYARSYLTSGFSGLSLTVGAAGAAGAASGNGGAGGNSTFGGLIACPGGAGGNTSGPDVPPSIQPALTPSTIATGGNIINTRGAQGSVGIGMTTLFLASGSGGASVFGGGAPSRATTVGSGVAALNPGAGGSGGLTTPTGAAQTGGAGAPGIIIIMEYA